MKGERALFEEIGSFIIRETQAQSFLFAKESSFEYLYIDESLRNRASVPVEREIRSMLACTMDTGMADIENELSQSMRYAAKIDNPLDLEISAIAVVPYIKRDGRCMGAFILYKERQKFQKSQIEDFFDFLSSLERDDEGDKDSLFGCENIMTHYELEKRLDRSNRFFSSIIHDIRTPMNAVLGFLELLAEDARGDALDYIEAAHKSGEMVVALVNDVLDINKLESGRLDIDPHFFSLLKEFENTVLLFYHTALKKKIDFTVYFDPKIPYLVKSDPYRIKQIVNNLLSNAFKFTPAEGCVEMDFFYEADSDELSISVRDTGIGISQEESKYIFEPFRQASERTSAQFGGTGLGLAISKQLSILLGGGLELESEKGKGSRFTLKIPCSCSYIPMPSIDRPIDLPKIFIIEGANCRGRHIKILESYFDALDIEYSLTKASQEELSRIEREEDSIYIGVEMSYKNDAFISFVQKKSERVILLETTLFPELPDIPKSVRVLKLPLLPHSLFEALRAISKGEESNKKVRESGCKSGKIVLADDNPIILKLLRELTLRMGHTAKEAHNGKEALEILRNESADVLFIDRNMPIMDGMEAIKLIRELPTGKELRIYALTGDWDEETRKSFLSVGADGVLHKPLDIDEFRRLICL